MINLEEVRDYIAHECTQHDTCTGCKLNSFGLGVCMLKNISNEEIAQFEQILKDNKAADAVCNKELEMARLRSEIDTLFKAVYDFKCLK